MEKSGTESDKRGDFWEAEQGVAGPRLESKKQGRASASFSQIMRRPRPNDGSTICPPDSKTPRNGLIHLGWGRKEGTGGYRRGLRLQEGSPAVGRLRGTRKCLRV